MALAKMAEAVSDGLEGIRVQGLKAKLCEGGLGMAGWWMFESGFGLVCLFVCFVWLVVLKKRKAKVL